MAMCHPNWALVALLLLSSSVGGFMGMDQDATCTMDDKTHKAYYHCPDGYEVIYTGEGEKECNGKCYRKGDKASLRIAIERLLADREIITLSDKQMKDAVDKLINEQEVTQEVTLIGFLPAGRSVRITLYAPKKNK